jgi:uncharacterized membrane protein SirB2
LVEVAQHGSGLEKSVGILSLSKKYTRLGLDARTKRNNNAEWDKTFLFVLYICSAESALSYKKSPFQKDRKIY